MPTMIFLYDISVLKWFIDSVTGKKTHLKRLNKCINYYSNVLTFENKNLIF